LTSSAIIALDVAAGPYMDPAATGTVGLMYAAHTVDDPGSRKIRSRDVLHQTADLDVRVLDQRQTGIDDFCEVVRRYIGRHAHGDTGRPVDQQVRDPRREHGRFAFGLVVVRDEIDGLLVDIGDQLVGDACHAHLGVTHGGRRVAIHRAEISLAIDQHIAQREWLGHAHDRIVDGRVPVRVVFTDDVADDAG
jgi:hypothetical protein